MLFAKLRYTLASLALVTLSYTQQAAAAVVVDRSVDTIGLAAGFNASNVASQQNFLVRFSLSAATSLTGADIYSAFNPVTVGTGVTLKFRNDVAGAPDTNDLFNFTSTVSEIDSVGSSTNPSIQRLHANFAALDFAAGDYWFGMSGTGDDIGWNIDFNNLTPSDAYQLSGSDLLSTTGLTAALAFNLYDGANAVPEPTSLPLVLLAVGSMAYSMRRRKGTVVTR